ncbi:hypothetical protein BC629DRAFT_715 [Irpex lacteus]|nr:hypothetical protein BC629DRAFT_715 [Irpex lacteus]
MSRARLSRQRVRIWTFTVDHNHDMSRRNNNVRGPTSALTEFLRESGITPTTIARRVRTREVEQPVAGPSTEGQAADVAENDQPAQEEEKEYASDNLDDTDTEKPPPAKKRKLTKAQEAKQKAAAKKAAAAKKKKGGDDDDYSDNEDEDAYTALSKMWKDKTRPPNGGFCTCAKCGKQFTVTKYTQPATPPPGYLCHPCFKSSSSSSSDPFKKPLAPRKRKTADKRSITNFEERRIASLASLCVGIVSKHIDDVEALGEVGSVNLERIAKAIARDRSLTSENVKLLYDVANTTLTLYDATNLTPPALTTLPLLNPSLTSLRLDFCGRLTSSVLTSWSTSLPHLRRLELLGPFLVHPEAWCSFFENHGKLEGFLVTQSPRFDLSCVESLVSHCPSLKELRLKEIGLMSESFLEPLKSLQSLTYLDISHPGSPDALSSSSLISLMKSIGAGLEHLNLSGNVGVDDAFLMRGVKPYTRVLGELVLEGVGELTDEGVARFFDTWRDGPNSSDSDSEGEDNEGENNEEGEWTPNPPLTTISLARNPHLSTLSLTSLLTHSSPSLTSLSINSWRSTSHAALLQIGHQAKGLERVDVGWCREVDEVVVGSILQGCGGLRDVRVWGCQRVGVNCPRKVCFNLFDFGNVGIGFC